MVLDQSLVMVMGLMMGLAVCPAVQKDTLAAASPDRKVRKDKKTTLLQEPSFSEG
jgi:hypothetical protein